MSIRMPQPDSSILARRAAIVADLRNIVPGEGVIEKTSEMRAYETDGLTAYREVHEVDAYPTPTPTLLVRGADDFPKALAPIYRDICAQNPNAREVVIAGTRHVPMMDAPDEFNRVMQVFLDELPLG